MQALLERYFVEVLNGKRLDRIDGLFAPDVRYHSAGSPSIQGRKELAAWVGDYLEAVPDYAATLHEVVATPTHEVLRWSCTGTHAGTLLGIPASGRRFTLTGMTMVRKQDGRIVEGWVERDSLGLWRQLAALP